MFDLTSAEDGDDSGTPVVLQCTLPFLNLLHRPAVEVMIKRRLQMMIGVTAMKMMQDLVNKILEGEHLNLGPRFQL